MIKVGVGGHLQQLFPCSGSNRLGDCAKLGFTPIHQLDHVPGSEALLLFLHQVG